MRKLVALLALTTAIFAGSTLYYARELSRERQGRLAVPATVAAPPVLAAATPADAVPPPVVAEAKPAAKAPKSAPRKPQLQDYDVEFLAAVADPAGRPRLIEQQVASLRRIGRGMDKALGLNAAEFDRLLELRAEQNIQLREAMLHCAQEAECDQSHLSDLRANQALELSTLLGTEGKQQFDDFLESANERSTVTQMRGRLPDADHLSDAQADLLVRTLSDERKRATSGMANISMSFEGVPIMASPNGSYDDYMEQARTYQARLRRSAAAVLTPGQLVVYDQLAAERLERVGYMVESAMKEDR